MLQQTTFDLAQQTSNLTAIARTQSSLTRLAGWFDPHGPNYFPQAINYNDDSAFMTAVEQAWQRDRFDLVLAWFHDSGEHSLKQLLTFLANQNHPTQFFHVMGSAAADPSQNAAQFEPNTNGVFSYHQVILGFKIENGRSRWLYNHEISAGVTEAIQQQSPRFIVGTVEPWTARP